MEQIQISRWIEMAGVTVKTTMSPQVEARVRSGKCLQCESKARRRGLCDKHYLQFSRHLSSKPKKERADVEMQMINDGVVLASGEIRRIHNENNPFSSY